MTAPRISDIGVRWLAFATSAVVYIGVGYWLCVVHGFIMGDALSRVSAAQTVLFSRDPHLAAIGFVFTPLTALLELPTVGLSPIWPIMTQRAFAGVVMSGLFMGAAASEIFMIGADRGLRRPFTLAIAALFALNPMIIFYGSNGMSEAPYVFCACWAVRRIVRWVRDDDVHHLVSAGIALGLAYLTRYDAVGPIAATAVLVAGTTFFRAKSGPRVHRALLDGILVALPGFAAFVGWAATGWLITGQAFAQFSSQYGNASILAQSGGGSGDFTSGVTFAIVCTLLLAPTLLPTAMWVAAARGRRHDGLTVVVPVAVFGAALAFQAYSYASGATFGFLRFYILAIPLTVTMALLSVPDVALRVSTRPGKYALEAPTRRRLRRAGLVYAASLLLVAITVPTAAWGMGLPRYAPQEYALGAVLAPEPGNVTDRKAMEHHIAASFSTERKLAALLDSWNLADGSVLTDTVYGFAVVAATRSPKVYVVPSDYDFVARLNNPAEHGVQFLLAVPNTGRGQADALNLRYPTLYDTGADVGTLALEIPNDGADLPTYRLYRVLQALPAIARHP